MLGKCNLLKSLTSQTGTYFTFSQTLQDLTQQFGQNDIYRVVPSRFACLDLNFSSKTGKEVGEEFQNYFENACTFLRYTMGDRFLPSHTNALLWRTLEKYGLITLEDKESDNPTDENPENQTVMYKTCGNLKYIGNININSYEKKKDGIGYNEIYVVVPEGVRSTEYRFTDVGEEEEYVYDGENICGWEGESDRDLSWVARCEVNNSDEKYYGIRGWAPWDCMGRSIGEGNTGEESFVTKQERKDDDPFTFNTIVVFYDILNKSKDVDDEDSVLYENVPMGIYFTGISQENTLTNFVTHWSQNPEIYNQGTSYGLRICTRYLCSEDVMELSSSMETVMDIIPEYAAVMEQFAESNLEIQDLLNSNNDLYRLLKSHLDMFKNNQVNVPYPKLVGSYYYWFVNGKNTGRRIETGLIPMIENIQKEYEELKEEIETKVQVEFVELGANMDDIIDTWENTGW